MWIQNFVSKNCCLSLGNVSPLSKNFPGTLWSRVLEDDKRRHKLIFLLLTLEDPKGPDDSANPTLVYTADDLQEILLSKNKNNDNKNT